MKIRISKKWWSHYVREQPGNTQADKETAAERIWSGLGRKWAEGMRKAKGQWLDVETEFLFDSQFNVKDIRVMVSHIDGIKFGPEFKSLDDFKDVVQKRYDKDWPGSEAKCAVLCSYIKSGFIKVEG